MTAHDDDFRKSAPQRKIANGGGFGIQYLPGHVEPYMDHCLSLLAAAGAANILELGGGGLRFALPAMELAALGRLTVVDPDAVALSVARVAAEVAVPAAWLDRAATVLEPWIGSAQDFFWDLPAGQSFDAVAAFRVFHFMTEAEFAATAAQVARCLVPGGLFLLSGLGRADHDCADGADNDFFRASQPQPTPWYRRIDDRDPAVARQLAAQNLGDHMLFMTPDWMDPLLSGLGFSRVEPPMAATRIVSGHVFRKT